MSSAILRNEGSVGPVEGAPPSFNLWSDRWISVERPDGRTEEIGIRDCLIRAHELRRLREASPLAVVGIHRLLTAIAQSLVQPADIEDVRNLLSQGQFADNAIAAFGDHHGGRFDLFSSEAPFMQTNDAPTTPKRGELKPVASLMPELPTATNVVHWRHAYDGEHRFCPPCVAASLLITPPFATSAGRGFRPSINGVPPLYVLPSGSTLFESLAFSVVAPPFQPEVRSEQDCPLWESGGRIDRSAEVPSVGYLQSLTFPARRMRLYPEVSSATCTRCGRDTSITVLRMLFEMGLSRPKTAASWFDPFVAYTLPKEGSDKSPAAVRPLPGRALWREYGTLFLSNSPEGKSARPPAVLSQMRSLTGSRVFTLRCIGMRTDMKAKVFEWTDESLQVPSGLLADRLGAHRVLQGIEHADTLAKKLRQIFNRSFFPTAKGKRGRYQSLHERMQDTYWILLAPHFHDLVLSAADRDAVETAAQAWHQVLLRVAEEVFTEAVDAVGNRGADLRRRTEALNACARMLGGLRKEWQA